MKCFEQKFGRKNLNSEKQTGNWRQISYLLRSTLFFKRLLAKFWPNLTFLPNSTWTNSFLIRNLRATRQICSHLHSLFLPVPGMIKMNLKNMELKDHECSVNGIGVKWNRNLRVLHSKTPSKCINYSPALSMR